MRGLPNLSALRAFEAAGRHESFVRAAEELSLTPAAISRHVRNLETELGQALFVRSHRAVSLTEAGARLAARTSAAFAEIAGFERSERSVRPTVTLDVDADVLARWLVPRLTPEVLAGLEADLRIRSRVDRPRLFPADTAIAVTWGAIDREGYSRRRLLVPRLMAMAAADGRVRCMNDLDGACLLHEHDDGWWRRTFDAAGRPYPERARSLTLDRNDELLDAAARGLGVTVGDDVIGDALLREGRLIALEDSPVLSSRSYYLVINRRRAGAAVGSVVRWVEAEAAAFAVGPGRAD